MAMERTRAHHALEHATVAVLFQRNARRQRLGGLSDPWGYTLYAGGLDAEFVETCAREALARLRAGEVSLAVSDECGTSLLTAGALGAGAALLAARKRPLANFPIAVAGVAAAMRAAPGIGRSLQRSWTLSTELEGARIAGVSSFRAPGGTRFVRVRVAWD